MTQPSITIPSAADLPSWARGDRIWHNRCSVPVFRGSADDGFFYAILFLSGGARYQSSSVRLTLNPGDLLLLGAWEQASLLPEGSDWEGIVLRLKKENWSGLAECFHPWAWRLQTEGIQRQYLTTLMGSLLEESQSQDPYAEVCSYAQLLLILVFLNRQTKIPQEQPAIPGSTMQYLLLYLNDHFTEDLSLDTLANRFFLSKYHLSREFQRVTGTSVHRYLVSRRLGLARELMAQGISLAEVCQRSGFGDYSSFYRAFKKEFGMTPKQWLAGSNGG